MKPDSKKGFIYLKMMMMKIPMTVFGGLQCRAYEQSERYRRVSIPMTVLGGLQLYYEESRG